MQFSGVSGIQEVFIYSIRLKVLDKLCFLSILQQLPHVKD